MQTATPLPRLPHFELAAERVQSTRGMRDVRRRPSMLRFHLDFIHVLKYLAQGAACVYIFHEWEMPGMRAWCLCAAPRRETIRRRTRPLPFSISRGVSRTWGTLEADTSAELSALLCVFTSYTDILKYMGVNSELLSRSNAAGSSGRVADYIHKQEVNLLRWAWWT